MSNSLRKFERVDVILLEQGISDSLDASKKLIMAGLVRIGSDRLVKNSSEKFPLDTEFNIEKTSPYVSRGAYKLKIALDKYLPKLSGMTAMDIGASTGGFTDIMLQYGAEKVYAVDVGYGQLHLKLRNNSKVINLEKINARTIYEQKIVPPVDIITMDVSFISVLKILPDANMLLKAKGWGFILIKPQFEAEKSEVGKGGVVRDQNVRDKCIKKVRTFVQDSLNWNKTEILTSPIKGPKGNIEYILVKTP